MEYVTAEGKDLYFFTFRKERAFVYMGSPRACTKPGLPCHYYTHPSLTLSFST